MVEEKVVSIELIPFEGEVFNMTVEEDNSYVLNNIVTHNCICYKVGVLMDGDVFVDRLRGWMWGTEPWAAMDGYADWLGVGGAGLGGMSLAVGMAEALAVWLWGDEEALDARVGDVQLSLGF